MLDLNNDLSHFYNVRHELENNILKCVTDFVSVFGKISPEEVSFNLNPSELSEVIDMPTALVEVDRKTGDCNWERIERIYIRKAGANLLRLSYETESYSDSFCYLDTDSMIEVYMLLKSFGNDELEDIDIKNYGFVVKE